MPGSYRFGHVEVLAVERQLLVDGRPATVGARAFDVLLALIERRDRVVTKNELLDIVWPGLVVEENNLQVQVSALRKVIGPQALATIPGRGYRLSMAIEGLSDTAPHELSPGVASKRTNLPAATEALIGREADVAALRSLVSAHRLVTVLGAGGIGKTRLAKEVGRGCVEDRRDGVWWVDLAAVSTADKIAPTIAGAANLKLAGGDAVTLLAHALAQRELLLVLDNCEHLAAGVAAVASAALEAAAGLTILATSQVPLKLQCEHLYRLDSLAVPPADASVEAARTFGAMQLLELRAQAIDRRFALDAGNVAATVDLCRHLDGIALAIEMAAARLPVLGLEALNARLGERLRLLRSTNRDAPPRYQTMRATLDWSHSLLDGDEQAVLRRLAVFAGSFRLDMAQRVAAGEGLDEWSALDCLAGLVEKSLVQVERIDPPRYRLLETTRLYGLEKLAEHGETARAVQRHGEAMSALAEEAIERFGVEAETPCARRYIADYDDLRAAFDRACERRDGEIAGAAGQALTRLDLARGVYSTMLHRKQAAHSLLPGPSPLAHARLWTCIAFSRYTAFPAVPKLEAAREEVAAWRRVGDRKRLYEALSRSATAHGSAGNFDAAERALAEARELEDPAWPPHMRLVLANNAATVGAYGRDPHTYAERARAQLALAQQAGSERLSVVARDYLFEAKLNSGRLEEAIALGRAVVAELRATDIPLTRAIALSNLCDALLMADKLESVPALAAEALPLALHNGVAGWLFDPLALYAARTGRAAIAAKLLGYADANYRAINEIRRLHDERSALQAAAAIDAAIGAPEHARLRSEGAKLGLEQADTLAREAIGA